MTITPEESKAYRLANGAPPNWREEHELANALRRHVAAEMRLEFEKDHKIRMESQLNNDLTWQLTPYCIKCGFRLNDEHGRTEADWNRAADEALR